MATFPENGKGQETLQQHCDDQPRGSNVAHNPGESDSTSAAYAKWPVRLFGKLFLRLRFASLTRWISAAAATDQREFSMNLCEWLMRTAMRSPQAPALLRGAQVIANYSGFAERVLRLAEALHRRLGVRPGDRVALFLANRTEYLELLYATWAV